MKYVTSIEITIEIKGYCNHKENNAINLDVKRHIFLSKASYFNNSLVLLKTQ